ncbi:hypothetical protein WDU94_015535 [Cyamophila willieti]
MNLQVDAHYKKIRLNIGSKGLATAYSSRPGSSRVRKAIPTSRNTTTPVLKDTDYTQTANEAYTTKTEETCSCQNKKIPASIDPPNLLKLDLVKLTTKFLSEVWQLAIPTNMMGKYYGIPIAACILTPNTIVVRVKIPIRRANKGWKGVNVRPIPIRDFNATCMLTLPSHRAITSNKLGKVRWILDDIRCKPEVDQLCLIPGGITTKPINQLSSSYPATWVPESSTILTHLEKEKFAITNPPSSFQIHCGATKEVEFIKLPPVVHGHIELHIPCDCLAIIAEVIFIEKLFPCDSSWATNVTAYHVLPFNWTLPSETEKLDH